MSLAPAERLALARIENELRRSDPALAARLRAFGGRRGRRRAPACERRRWWWPGARRLQLLTAAAAVLLGVLWGVVFSASAGLPAHYPACARGWHVPPCAAQPGPARERAQHRQPQPGRP